MCIMGVTWGAALSSLELVGPVAYLCGSTYGEPRVHLGNFGYLWRISVALHMGSGASILGTLGTCGASLWLYIWGASRPLGNYGYLVRLFVAHMLSLASIL